PIMKIAAAQISCAPGDLKANVRKIRNFSAQAKKSGTELVVFPEMVDTGYSMPAIQEHATSWNEGAVPKLQETAKELSIAILDGVYARDSLSVITSHELIDENVTL